MSWAKVLAGLTIVGGTTGIVFGLAASTSTLGFVNLDTPKTADNIMSYGEGITPTESKWNIDSNESNSANHIKTGKISLTNEEDKYDYAAEIIDGTTHEFLDKSFNEGTYLGLIQWIVNNPWELGKTIDHSTMVPPNEGGLNYVPGLNKAYALKPSSDNPDGFEAAYDTAIHAGKKVLVLPGFMHITPLINYLNNFHGVDNPELDYRNNIGFILIDGNIEGYKEIASLMFRADEAAFLAGIATCQYLNDNYDEYKDGGLNVATFGGTPIPTVTIYMGGFEQGVKYFNENILPKLADKQSDIKKDEYINEHRVNVIDLGVQSSWFSGTFNIGDAKLMSQTLLAHGADAIMPVAGPQTADVVNEIVNQNSSAIVIGVDTDQENSDMNKQSPYTDKNGNNDVIKFSAQKNIADMTSSILNLAAQDDFNNKDSLSNNDEQFIGSFGYLTVGDLTNSGVKLSEAGNIYLINAIANIGSSISTIDDAINYLSSSGELDNLENSMYFIY